VLCGRDAERAVWQEAGFLHLAPCIAYGYVWRAFGFLWGIASWGIEIWGRT